MLFSKVAGQDYLKKHFIQEINSGKISHARLFLGHAGSGTLPLALGFVQYLFCRNKGSVDSCGQCDQCIKVSQLQHPDLHFSFPTVQAEAKFSREKLPEWRKQITENPYFNLKDWVSVIDPKGRNAIIGSEESLEIVKALSLKSYEGSYKVMIIWCANDMNVTAANKLLKILEEPPAKTLFILIAETEDTMLKTILSRTQIVKIPRLDTDAIAAYLHLKNKIPMTTASNISTRSEGNLRLGIEMAENNDINGDELKEFIQFMRICYKKDVIAMLEWSDAMGSEARDRQKSFLHYCLHMFRQSILKNYTQDILVRLTDDETDFLKNFARFITGNNIIDFNETFNNAIYHIDRNANAKIVLTNVCFKVMRFIHFA